MTYSILEPFILAIVIVKSVNNNSCELVVPITLEVTNADNSRLVSHEQLHIDP